MKHIKYYEKIIDDRIFIKNKIMNILQVIGHDVNINDDILKCVYKNNKIYNIYLHKNFSKVWCKISTLTNKNSIDTELLSSTNLTQILDVYEYLKNKYPEEYKISLLINTANKYNF
jgi:uncharacterized protein VirK/YbjX